MNWKFWDNKPAGKPRMVGMSGGVVKAQKKTEPKPKEQIQKVAKVGSVPVPLQPYISIVIGDIKSFLRIDDKSRKEKETYNDFMEQHFKKH